MKKAMLCAVAFGLMTTANADADWDYEHVHQWGTLSQKYAACNGLNQSPINIERSIKAELEPLKFSYNTLIQSIQNNGHTVQVDFAQGELAVVAMMYEQGKENPLLKQMWKRLPKHKGEKVVLSKPQPVQSMLPENKEYYRFSGSLTTPPCSEGVRWLVLKEIQTASQQQIQQFADLMGHPNNRPIQPLNGRVVVEN